VKTFILGADIGAGMQLQLCVPRNVWQGSRLTRSGSFALLGCTVSPGFEYADYESGSREALSRQYPQAEDAIRALTHD
jgi:hypothetical protein